jgi:glycosyltransferase involved in cell wall biosynthesis
MQWFYAQMDLIFVNSNYYKQCWMDLGVKEEKLEVLPRGIDTELFNPRHHNPSYWKCKGARGTILLYVGRVSKEKELEFLADVYLELKQRKAHVSLAIVGDGPYTEELKQKIPDALFTGIITGHELGVAYASADLFLFPSTTDTFGNVVIEALASGVPTFVTDQGGPMELIRHEHEGRVLPARNLSAWVNAVEDFIRHPISRAHRVQRAEVLQAERSWEQAFQKFWNMGDV